MDGLLFTSCIPFFASAMIFLKILRPLLRLVNMQNTLQILFCISNDIHVPVIFYCKNITYSKFFFLQQYYEFLSNYMNVSQTRSDAFVR